MMEQGMARWTELILEKDSSIYMPDDISKYKVQRKMTAIVVFLYFFICDIHHQLSPKEAYKVLMFRIGGDVYEYV